MLSKTDRKICGTCEHWAGNREPVFDKNSQPKINIIDDYGICLKIGSRFTDQRRKMDLHCQMYSKWPEIL